MFRKFTLALVTAGVLLGGVLLYRQHTSPAPRPAALPIAGAEISRAVAASTEPAGNIGGVPFGGLENPVWYYADPQTGRRKAVYRAGSARQVGEELLLTDPRIELLPESGQTILITAEKGRLLADITGGKIVPRRAALEGSVLVALRRPAGPDGRTDEGDFIRGELQSLDLDLQRQEMEAPGPVTIRGAGVAMEGRDLTVSWNTTEGPAPWTLRRLRLAGGGQLRVEAGALKQASNRGGASSRPAATAASAPADPVYSLTLHDQVQIAGPRGWLKDASSLEALFSYRPQKDLVNSSSAAVQSSAASPAGNGTSGVQVSPAATAPNGADVTVVSWAGPLEMVPAGPKVIPPGAGQARVIARGGLDGRMSMGSYQKAAAPTGADANGDAAAPQVEMAAKCDYFEAQGDAARLSASGEQPVELVMADGITIVGRDVSVDDRAGKARLEGAGTIRMGEKVLASATAPAATAPRGEPESPMVAWQRSLVLDYLVQTDPAGRVNRVPTVAELEGQAVFRARDGFMSAEHMRVPFGAPDPAAPADTSGKRRLPRVDRVDAWENVRLAGSLTDSFPQTSDVLPGQGASAASGGGKGELTAGKVSIFLRPATAAEQAVRRAPFMPTRVEAAENVVLAQPEQNLLVKGDALTSNLEAGEHRLGGAPASVLQGSAQMMAASMVLHTRPNGQLLRVEVPCPGSAYMMMTEDLNGRALPAPRPAIIRWGQRMLFEPADRAALAAAQPGAVPHDEDDPIQDRLSLTGDVAFDSADSLAWPVVPGQEPADSGPGDHLRCQQLKLTFSPVDEPSPASQPVVRASARVLAAPATAAAARPSAGLPLGRRSVQTVHAITDVRLASQMDDGEGYLQRRMLVRSQDVRLIRRNGELLAQGRGDMGMEDYRPPAPLSAQRLAAQQGRQGMMPQQYERPSQIVFAWSRQMRLSRPDGKTWIAQFDPIQDPRQGVGAVSVRWRSGKTMAAFDKLRIRQDAAIPPGHITELDCGYLEARFQSDPNKPARPTGAAPGGLEDLRLAVEKFEAVHGVRLKNTADTTLEVFGGRLMYDGASEQITVLGDLEGSDRVNASLFYRDARGQPLDIPPYPRLIITNTKSGLDVKYGEKPRVAPAAR